MTKILTLYNDSDSEDPHGDCGQWTLHAFSRRHHHESDPSKFFDDNGNPHIGIRRKLEVGTAFIVSYYEHGQCVWSIEGTGPQCQWDNVRKAGILVWEHPVDEMGAKTYEARQKDAASFLETYTCWCNGDVYGYSVEEKVTLPCGHTELRDVDSCFGFFGNGVKYMAEQVRAAIDGDPEVEIKGEAKYLADHHDFVSPLPKKEVAESTPQPQQE